MRVGAALDTREQQSLVCFDEWIIHVPILRRTIYATVYPKFFRRLRLSILESISQYIRNLRIA